MKPSYIAYAVSALLIVVGLFMVLRPVAPQSAGNQNVQILNGTQVITISARGGYDPRISYAKAGIPTKLKFKTTGSFDCSSFLVVPSLKVREQLPSEGEKIVDVPVQSAGSVLKGFCGMGMYNFEVHFD